MERVVSPYPLDISLFITIVCLLCQACSTGIPAIGEPFSRAIGLTVSLAPMTSVRSVSLMPSFISYISNTTTPLGENTPRIQRCNYGSVLQQIGRKTQVKGEDGINAKITRTQGEAAERVQAVNTVKKRSKSISLESDQRKSDPLEVADLRPELIGSRVGRP
jgi:hypothetical protein